MGRIFPKISPPTAFLLSHLDRKCEILLEPAEQNALAGCGFGVFETKIYCIGAFFLTGPYQNQNCWYKLTIVCFLHGLRTYCCCVRFYPNLLAAVAVCGSGSGLPSLWNSHSPFVNLTLFHQSVFSLKWAYRDFKTQWSFPSTAFCLYYTLKLWQNVAFLVNVLIGKKGGEKSFLGARN